MIRRIKKYSTTTINWTFFHLTWKRYLYKICVRGINFFKLCPNFSCGKSRFSAIKNILWFWKMLNVLQLKVFKLRYLKKWEHSNPKFSSCSTSGEYKYYILQFLFTNWKLLKWVSRHIIILVSYMWIFILYAGTFLYILCKNKLIFIKVENTWFVLDYAIIFTISAFRHLRFSLFWRELIHWYWLKTMLSCRPFCLLKKNIL